MQFVLLGDRRQMHDLPILLRQHMAGEVVLGSRCMISTIAPESLSLSRL